MKKQKSINVLGFDPYTQEYGSWIGPNGEKLYELTPERAQYILDNHNYDNREHSPGQQSKLGKSIDDNGYQKDGDALRFNTEGNTPEYQHRLREIVKRNLTVYVPLVLGVTPESFTKTAGALPRGPWSEISRIDKTAKKHEATDLGVVILRRNYKASGEELTLQNASTLWPIWKQYVRKGEKLVEDFFENTDSWKTYRRVFSAWATLMVYYDEEHGTAKYVKPFLEMLKNETLEIESKKLTKQFLELFTHKEAAFYSNAQRPRFMWYLLCVASDRMKKRMDGNIELYLSILNCNHDDLKKDGIYRLFLVNPDNISTQAGFKVAAE